MSKIEAPLESSLAELRKARAQVRQLQQKVESERRQELRSLHQKLGFETRAELIQVLRSLGGAGRTHAGSAAKARTSKRARITSEMKQSIVRALQAGESGSAVARRFGISNPSLHNIKKAAGLVKARKKRGKRS